MAAAAGAALAIGIVSARHGLPNGRITYDLGCFWESGAAWRAGIDVYMGQYLGDHERTLNPNLNPPIWLPAFAALSALDPVHAFKAVWVANLLSIVALAEVTARRAGWRPGHGALWAFASAPMWQTIIMGQVYGVLALLAVVADRGGPSTRAAALGAIVALKPQFALALPVIVFAGHWRLAVRAGAAGAGLTLGSIAALGWPVHAAWLSVLGAFLPPQSGWSATLAGDGPLLFVAAVAAVGVRARRVTDERDGLAVGLCAALLLAPVAWVGYALVLLPTLARRAWAPAAGALLCAPLVLCVERPELVFRLPSILAVLLIMWSPWSRR